MPHHSPQVSILLPTHNRADVLPYSIESVLNQTLTDFELLIVGDGCTDQTAGIVTEYQRQDSRIKWFGFPKGPGFGYAHRNTVLKQATGKFWAFAAHDDLWFPDHLEQLVTFFTAQPQYTVAYTRPLWVHPTGIIIPSTFNTDHPHLKKSFLSIRNEIPAHCVMQTMAALRAVGYWNAELPQAADWDVWKQIVHHDPHHRIGFIPTPTSLHFRANWRTEATSMDPVLKMTLKNITADRELKKALTVSSTKKKPLQQLISHKLRQPPWITELRRHTQAALDYQARKSNSSAQQVQELSDRVIRLTENLNRVTATKGYQLLERLRQWLPIKTY